MFNSILKFSVSKKPLRRCLAAPKLRGMGHNYYGEPALKNGVERIPVTTLLIASLKEDI